MDVAIVVNGSIGYMHLGFHVRSSRDYQKKSSLISWKFRLIMVCFVGVFNPPICSLNSNIARGLI